MLLSRIKYNQNACVFDYDALSGEMSAQNTLSHLSLPYVYLTVASAVHVCCHDDDDWFAVVSIEQDRTTNCSAVLLFYTTHVKQNLLTY